MLRLVALMLTLSAAFASAQPIYLPFDDTFEGNLFLEIEGAAAAPAGEPTASPRGLRIAWTDAPDFAREAPWTTVFAVVESGAGGEMVRLTVGPHASVAPVARWVNDELLHVRVWWGRIAGSDLVLDVARGEFVYRRTFFFPPDPPEPGGGATAPDVRLSLEHVAGAPPPDWSAVRVLAGADARQIEVTTLPPMITDCFFEPSDEDLGVARAWLDAFLRERRVGAPPRPTESVCRNCTLYRLEWRVDGEAGAFEFSEARPYRYEALDLLFPLLARLLARAPDEGECAA